MYHLVYVPHTTNGWQFEKKKRVPTKQQSDRSVKKIEKNQKKRVKSVTGNGRWEE